MRGALIIACFFCALVVGTSAAAAPFAGNLDADAAWERVAVQGPTGSASQRVVLTDRCASSRVSRVLTSGWDAIERLSVRELDGATARREVFVDARNGATGAIGVVKVVRMKLTGCAQTRTVFRYSPLNPILAPLPGRAISGFSVWIENYRRDRPGLELRLQEGLAKPDEPECCPSRVRVSYFVYAPDLGRYSMYSSRTHPVS